MILKYILLIANIMSCCSISNVKLRENKYFTETNAVRLNLPQKLESVCTLSNNTFKT